MADSLVLKGVKDVRKHTGTEMQLVIPRRGGNTHQIKQWWRNGVNTPYCACTLFRVTTAVGTVYLALETGSSERATVKITHDGSFNFTFSHLSQLKRAALYNESRQLIEHYAFPAIVNGPIVKVTPPGAADRPSAAPPAKVIDGVTVSGEEAPTVGVAYTYSAAASGTTSDFTYTWGLGGGETITSGDGTDEIEVTWSSSGNNGVTCVVGSTDENWDNVTQTDTLNVAIAAPPPPASGPADSVTLVDTATTQAAGSIAATATTSANGNGLTVTYDSDGTDASNLAIADPGDGYQEGDTFTVNGDTVTGTVSIATVLTANNAVADASYVVTQAGGYYYIDGVQQAEITANAGETIYFDLSDASLSGHPFKIYVDSSKTTLVTVGVESDANGLIFTPPISGTFSYQCASHAGMGGDITVNA